MRSRFMSMTLRWAACFEVFGIDEGPMGEVMMLQIAPGKFDIVEFGRVFRRHSTVSQGRAASALPVSRLMWIGPLSRTRTAGRAVWPGCGPKRRSIISRSATTRRHTRSSPWSTGSTIVATRRSYFV
jgi:hypothetical protein